MINFAKGYNPEDWPQEPEMTLRMKSLQRNELRRSLMDTRKAMDAFLDATALEWEANEAYREDAKHYPPAPQPETPAYLSDFPLPQQDDQEEVFSQQPALPAELYWGNAPTKERRRKRLEEENRHKRKWC